MTAKLPKRVPAWAKNSIKETRDIYVDTVGSMIEDLQQCPPGAYVDIGDEDGYGACYGHDEISVSWYRDHTPEEYHRERKQRAAKAKKRKKDKAVEAENHRQKILAEAIRLGIV